MNHIARIDILDKLTKIANVLDSYVMTKEADDVDKIKNNLEYEPQLSIEDLKERYPKLAEDPVHKWRAETGIELIHREPTKQEQIRIWKNWKLMTDEQKKISDEKSKELFGMINDEHHKRLMHEWGLYDMDNRITRCASELD